MRERARARNLLFNSHPGISGVERRLADFWYPKVPSGALKGMETSRLRVDIRALFRLNVTICS
jgi:hypothetical protein